MNQEKRKCGFVRFHANLYWLLDVPTTQMPISYKSITKKQETQLEIPHFSQLLTTLTNIATASIKKVKYSYKAKNWSPALLKQQSPRLRLIWISNVKYRNQRKFASLELFWTNFVFNFSREKLWNNCSIKVPVFAPWNCVLLYFLT